MSEIIGGMDTRPFVAFDLDDTLNRLRDGVCTTMTRLGFPCTEEGMTSYDWTTLFGAGAPDVCTVLTQHNLLESADPDEDAVNACRDLLNDGVRVEIWTARSWHPRAAEITRAWLDRVGLEETAVRLVGLTESKIHCLDGDPPALYVDDSIRQIRDLRSHGLQGACLIERPWSRNITNLPKVHDLTTAIQSSPALSTQRLELSI